MPPRKAGSSRQRVASIPLPATYPGLVEDKGLNEEQWSACRELLEGVYKAKDGNRKVSDIFRELPDKETYEDYYQAIPEPECLDNIATQLGAQAYTTPEAFFKQLHLVFLNAKHYNEEDSVVWQDAKRLEWTTKAEAGVFTHTDPYHLSLVKPGRKGKRGVSGRPSKSATPLPETVRAMSAKAATPLPVEPPARTLEPVARAAAPSIETAAKATTPVPPPEPAPAPAPRLPPAAIQVSVPDPEPTPAPSTMTLARSPLAQSQSVPPVGPPSPTPAEQAQRQAQLDADAKVVQALVATLPRWTGPQPVLPGDASQGGVPGSGWFGEGAPDYERRAGGPASYPNRIKAVLGAIAGYKDTSGQRLAEVLALIPMVAEIPDLSFQTPISLASIIATAKANRYTSPLQFDMDITRLFEKGRRWFADGSTEYGRLLALQRMYNALTGPYPMPLPPNGVPEPSPTLFASLPAGPGHARPMHETTQEIKAGAAEEQVGYGVTTFRVGSKDRIFTDEARHKGMTYRIGDYVHLINPDDATRPIIGQIFRTFVPTKGYPSHHATVCWYYRPEQTVHTADRMIFEREVFKTGHFCDHPIEDILEKITVQFYVKYIRGRPRAGEYYPGWPIYVCHSRFNDREHLMVRIKNWNSCIPDELRQTDFMSIVPFSRIVEIPMLKSPFLRGITGPGFIGEPKSGADEEEEEEDERPRRREKPKREISSTPLTQQPMVLASGSVPGPSRLQAPTPQVPVSAPTSISALTSLPPAAPVMASRPIPTFQPVGASFPNRTIAAIMGGQQALDQVAVKELLPLNTARMFERDARGQVLWFSGPPLAPGTIRVPEQPAHSLEYLTYLTKRKTGTAGPSVEEQSTKRGRWAVQQRDEVDGEEDMISEPVEIDLGRIWWAEGQSGDQVVAGLKALVDTVKA